MKTRFRTLQYTLICVTYFAAFSGVHAYASIFLIDRGFTNTLIGMTLALANVLSVILQPLVGGWIDKANNKLTNRTVSIICALSCGIICSLLYAASGIGLVFVLYVLLYTLQMLYQPFIQTLCFEYNEAGDHINFGLARGLGSCGFAATSSFIGFLLAQKGVSALQIVNIIAFSLGVLVLLLFVKPENTDTKRYASLDKADGELSDNSSIIQFIKTYPLFMLFVLGGTLLFFEHNVLNDYLIQIITPLGGDGAIMGNMVMLAAVLELPSMAAFSWLEKKFGIKKILFFAAVMFTVKTLLMFFATNIFMAFVSQACQIFAYALFIPGMAYLSEKVMNKCDRTKGQAYVNCCITLGGVFSALICGRLLDVKGASAMLLVTCIIGLVGTIIVSAALYKMKFVNK